MIVVKIKYKGQWRKVIGTCSVYGVGTCYKVQCLDDKRFFNTIWVRDRNITAIEEKDTSKYPSTKTRYKMLSLYQKGDIYREYQSGKYYVKEICERNNISIQTFYKVIKEYELRSKTNEM